MIEMVSVSCLADGCFETTAKHLEPLKGGKIPVEILVTSKDPEEKMKSFEKCIDVIKNAGVSILSVSGVNNLVLHEN